MTRAAKARTARRLAVLLLALVLGGCTYYPTVKDVGGLRIRPENGRLVRDTSGLAFYVDLRSTSSLPDTVLGASLDGAHKASLVGAAGAPLDAVVIPGEQVTRFQAGGAHVVFSEVERALKPGEVVLVTLYFEKYGPMGVVTVVE